MTETRDFFQLRILGVKLPSLRSDRRQVTDYKMRFNQIMSNIPYKEDMKQADNKTCFYS